MIVYDSGFPIVESALSASLGRQVSLRLVPLPRDILLGYVVEAWTKGSEPHTCPASGSSLVRTFMPDCGTQTPSVAALKCRTTVTEIRVRQVA